MALMRSSEPAALTGLDFLEPSTSAGAHADAGWFERLRDQGRHHYTGTGLPTRKVEDWKYTDLRALAKASFRAPSQDDGGAACTIPAFGSETQSRTRIVFVNGTLRADLSTAKTEPQLTISSLREVLAENGAAIEPYLGELTDAHARSLASLNTAMMNEGCVIRVAADAVIEQPIDLIFLGGTAADPVAYHPRVLIIVGEGSSATVIERHHGIGNQTYFSNSVTEIFLSARAHLNHYKLQDENQNAWHIATCGVAAEHQASYENFVLATGSKLARHELCARLNGSGANCRIGGSYLARGAQHSDLTTVIHHFAEESRSTEIFKGVVDGDARAVFQGRITVQRNAQRSEGRLMNKALLLSDRAEIDQKPELEIYADDVKCSHGATAGQLDLDALFYLRSRGLTEALARRLLIEGFLAEAFDTLSQDDVRAAFVDSALRWLNTHDGDAE